MYSTPQQIHVPNTLDVEAVERTLAELWQQTAGQRQADREDAVMRARAANIMVFLNNDSWLSESQQIISELASIHPCRALLMVGDRKAAARDIEMYVSAFRATQKRSESRDLCCEEITLVARGEFVSELPSAAVPLLVSDLPVFLWWREVVGAEDKIFKQVSRAANRVVIDSADFQDPLSHLGAIAELFNRKGDEAIVLSDINWARLTPWRAALANFYDVQDYRAGLDQITEVRIDYVAEKASPFSSQALLIAGWLASRLNWELSGTAQARESPASVSFNLTNKTRLVRLHFNEVQRPAMKSGRLAQIELKASGDATSFLVSRSADGLHLETHATIGERSCPGRWLPVRNQSTAQLLSREMEILCSDKIYAEAIAVAASMATLHGQ